MNLQAPRLFSRVEKFSNPKMNIFSEDSFGSKPVHVYIEEMGTIPSLSSFEESVTIASSESSFDASSSGSLYSYESIGVISRIEDFIAREIGHVMFDSPEEKDEEFYENYIDNVGIQLHTSSCQEPSIQQSEKGKIMARGRKKYTKEPLKEGISDSLHKSSSSFVPETTRSRSQKERSKNSNLNRTIVQRSSNVVSSQSSKDYKGGGSQCPKDTENFSSKDVQLLTQQQRGSCIVHEGNHKSLFKLVTQKFKSIKPYIRRKKSGELPNLERATSNTENCFNATKRINASKKFKLIESFRIIQRTRASKDRRTRRNNSILTASNNDRLPSDLTFKANDGEAKSPIAKEERRSFNVPFISYFTGMGQGDVRVQNSSVANRSARSKSSSRSKSQSLLPEKEKSSVYENPINNECLKVEPLHNYDEEFLGMISIESGVSQDYESIELSISTKGLALNARPPRVNGSGSHFLHLKSSHPCGLQQENRKHRASQGTPQLSVPLSAKYFAKDDGAGRGNFNGKHIVETSSICTASTKSLDDGSAGSEKTILKLDREQVMRMSASEKSEIQRLIRGLAILHGIENKKILTKMQKTNQSLNMLVDTDRLIIEGLQGEIEKNFRVKQPSILSRIPDDFNNIFSCPCQ